MREKSILALCEEMERLQRDYNEAMAEMRQETARRFFDALANTGEVAQ